MYVYKRFHKPIRVSAMKGLQWFALTPDYGPSYGPIVHTFQFRVKPHLLNIGDSRVREEIVRVIQPTDPQIVRLSHPDIQYAGGADNRRYHELVKKYFGQQYDGTIIVEKETRDPDLEGATEIVLWKKHSKLIKRV